MADFRKLLNVCEINSEKLNRVVEDFLFKNVVNLRKLNTEIHTRFHPYKHIFTEISHDTVDLFMTQYLAHTIFKEDGLIGSYLNHSAIKKLNQTDRDFLQYLYEKPWKFSFSIIKGYPHDDFFEMEDVFSGESFILYSQGVTNILRQGHVALWFNLIGYNGYCWQTYGPISSYLAFTPDDIFFFATELHPYKGIETDEDVMSDVENNPIPYMMLIAGSNFPLTAHKNDTIIQAVAEYDIDTFITDRLHKDFNIGYTDNVYRLALKRWSDHPHFCCAYYDEIRKVLSLFSMTDRGFSKLADKLNNAGFKLNPDPDLRVTMAMYSTAANILKKEIRLNEYEDLFTKNQTAADTEHLSRLNRLLELALPDLNAGVKPDIKNLSQQTGLEEETVQDLIKHVTGKIESMKRHR